MPADLPTPAEAGVSRRREFLAQAGAPSGHRALILNLECLEIPFIASLFNRRKGEVWALMRFLFVQDSGADIDIVGSGKNGKDDNPVNSKI